MHKLTAALLSAYNRFATFVVYADAKVAHLLEEAHADVLREVAKAKQRASERAADMRRRATQLEADALEAEEKAVAFVEDELAKIGRSI